MRRQTSTDGNVSARQQSHGSGKTTHMKVIAPAIAAEHNNRFSGDRSIL
jgi:hypothetical protein